jgi:hypothetical protein
MWLLLYHGWMEKWKGSIYFYTLSRQVDHELNLIWAGPPAKKCHDNEANINTRKVTLLTHNSCRSSCIMARGQIQGIHLFFILFLNSLTMNYTTSNLATYLEVVLGWTTYHHQDCDTRNTGNMVVLLDHVSWTNGRDPSIFILFLNSLTMKYNTSNLATYLEVVWGWTTYHHQDGDTPNTEIMLVLCYNG